MPNTVRYREATIADVPAIARLCAESRQEEGYWKARIEGYLNLEFNPHQATTDRMICVAIKKEIIIGFIAGHLTKRQEYAGQIQWIGTALQNRRVGIASELLSILSEWFIGHDVKSVRVDIDPENTAAQEFYRHHHASGINQYWLYWDDIAVVVRDRDRADNERKPSVSDEG